MVDNAAQAFSAPRLLSGVVVDEDDELFEDE
jgi:hypothetical protein